MVQACVERGVERGLVQVAAALLHHIDGASVAKALVVEVGLVERGPVDLGKGCVARAPELFVLGCQFGVVHVGGQVAVVVGARVGSVVPVEGRVAVAAVVEGYAGVELHLGLYFPLVAEDARRVVGRYDARVALFAVLVAPVGVIQVVARQVVHLLQRTAALSALHGRAERRQGQAVASAVPLLLGHQGVREVAVERAVHVALVRVASAHESRKGPSVVVEARRVGKHAAQVVVAVGIGQRGLAAACIVAGTHENVLGTADGAEGKDAGHRVDGFVAVARQVVERTDGRIVEHAAVLVVERYAVDVALFVDVFIATHAKAHGRELVARGAQENVVRGEHARAHVLLPRLAVVVAQFEGGSVHHAHQREVLFDDGVHFLAPGRLGQSGAGDEQGSD